jgi:cytochrome c2
MRRRPVLIGLLVLVVGALVVGYAANQIEARQKLLVRVHALTGGDPAKGRVLIAAHACGGCHEVPGVAGATGHVGPSLDGIAGRAYIAGRLANSPDNLERWIVDPQGVEPGVAMPPAGVSPGEARDIAAYLYTLE